MEDAVKMDKSGENIGLKINGKTLVVERRKIIRRTDTIFYKLDKLKVQQYQLEFIANDLGQPGLAAFLEDNYLHTSTPVSLGDTTRVMFTVEDIPGSHAADRFRIVFQKLAPVPVIITSIEANRNTDQSIGIKWKVENEINIQFYTVERSADGRNFTGIINTMATGNNGGNSSYSSNDQDPLSADNFYRIKALGRDGGIQYSAIVKLSNVKAVPVIMVYPNPVVNRILQVQFSNQPMGNYYIQLINELGQTVYSNNIQIDNSNVVRSMQLDAGIAAGTYRMIIVSASGNKLSAKVIVQ
jgi:hypothetical protein